MLGTERGHLQYKGAISALKKHNLAGKMKVSDIRAVAVLVLTTRVYRVLATCQAQFSASYQVETHFNPHNHPMKKDYYYLSFTEEETKA